MTIDGVRFKRADPKKGEVPGTTAKVVLEGKTTPNAEVVVENKSQAPFAPADASDVYVHAKAGADGSFAVELPAARDGDQFRLKSGASTVRVRLKEIESIDGRAPVVRQQGIRLVPDGDGFRFSNVSKNDVIGAAGNQLILTNSRTKEVTTFILDEEGRLPRDARLTGQRGDTWQVSTSDGVTRVDTGFGYLMAPPADASAEPRPTSQTQNATMGPLTGPLFGVGGPAPRTAVQGELGDCWLVAACDAIASTNPEHLRNIIKENKDGTYTVTFQRFDHDKGRYLADEVTVTKQVYLRGSKPLYGSSSVGDIWFPIVEKAYAQWKGGYDGVRAGYPFEAFEAILGAAGRHFDCDATPADAMWLALKKRSAAHEAMVTWSRVETPTLPFANTGVMGDHAYSILGVEERGGERYVKVRNPWGSNPWSVRNNTLGIIGDKDVLEVPLAVFMKLYGGLGSAPTAPRGVA